MNFVPKITIIIPVFNGALLIKRCLDSVVSQKGNFDLEIIVIDDGSNDDSVQIVKNSLFAIRLIQQNNQGPAAARNKGIEVATGKYLAFLDADDYWEPTFIEETINFLEIHKKAIAVSVGQKHITFGDPGSIVPKFLKTDPQKVKFPILLDNFFTFWAEHFHVCTGSILIRTEVVKQTCGQRIDLRITEDLEFWAYLATFGPIGFIPKVLFISDGLHVTRQIGWFNKNKKRWASAPTVQKWEERIIASISEKDYKFYVIARGRIAKNLSYSMIMSKRTKLAREISTKYGDSFPKDRVGKLLFRGSKTGLFWMITVLVIHIREYSRIIRIKS